MFKIGHDILNCSPLYEFFKLSWSELSVIDDGTVHALTGNVIHVLD